VFALSRPQLYSVQLTLIYLLKSSTAPNRSIAVWGFGTGVDLLAPKMRLAGTISLTVVLDRRGRLSSQASFMDREVGGT
jgi:hypothetical protein